MLFLCQVVPCEAKPGMPAGPARLRESARGASIWQTRVNPIFKAF